MGTIRLLLALAVLLIMHSTPIFGIKMIGAAGAVQGFYVISGFYMAMVLNEKYERGAAGYGEFIWQRFLRLMPAYWVCLILAIILGATGWGTILPAGGTISPYAFWQTHLSELPWYQAAYVVFTQIFLIGQDSLLFFGVKAGHGLFFVKNYVLTAAQDPAASPAYMFLFVGTAWSLGLEMMFYLVAPFIVRRRWQAIAAIVFISLCIRLSVWRLLHVSLGQDPWVYRFFPSELGTFLLGALGYHFYAFARRRKLNLRTIGWIAWIGMVAAIFAIPVLPIKGTRPAVFFLMMAMCVPFIFTLTKNWKLDRWIGELSYPLYIVHFVVGAALARAMNAHLLYDVKGWQLMAVSLPAAIVIRIFVEDPVERYRHRQYAKKIARKSQAAVVPV